MNALFAQERGGGQAGGADPAGVMMLLACGGVLVLLIVGLRVLFLMTLSKCVKQVSPRNRRMEPGQVWLNLIPFFNIVWIIITILRVSDSLRDEYDDRGLRGDDDFGRTAGLMSYIGSLVCGPVGLIGFIMYWVKISGYTKELQAAGEGDDYDDDYDDRPRKRKKRRDDDYDDEEDDDDLDARSRRNW